MSNNKKSKTGYNFRRGIFKVSVEKNDIVKTCNEWRFLNKYEEAIDTKIKEYEEDRTDLKIDKKCKCICGQNIFEKNSKIIYNENKDKICYLGPNCYNFFNIHLTYAKIDEETLIKYDKVKDVLVKTKEDIQKEMLNNFDKKIYYKEELKNIENIKNINRKDLIYEYMRCYHLMGSWDYINNLIKALKFMKKEKTNILGQHETIYSIFKNSNKKEQLIKLKEQDNSIEVINELKKLDFYINTFQKPSSIQLEFIEGGCLFSLETLRDKYFDYNDSLGCVLMTELI